MLQRHCEIVTTAEDSETAMAAVAKLRPDIITLDVSLPGSSGFALAKKFKQTLPAANGPRRKFVS